MLSDRAPFQVGYSDGRTAARISVAVSIEAAGLVLAIDGGPPRVWSYADLVVDTPLDKQCDSAILGSASEPGATLFVRDAGVIAEIVRRAPHLSTAAERWRALKPGLAVGAAALVAGLAVWLLDLSPTKAIARVMPTGVRTALGNAALDGMVAGRPRCVDPAGLAALRRLHERLQPGATAEDGITVVDWSLTNAFAVPGGRVVLTRAILQKAASPDEVAGVLAHEIGHGLELHPEAGLVRGVGFWAMLQLMFTGSPGTLGNIGGALAQLSYSRQAEREADARALDLLKAAGIATKPFAGFFRRLEKDEVDKPAQSATGRIMRANDVLSSHPPTAERIARIESVPDYAATPALADADWQALRKICQTKKQAG